MITENDIGATGREGRVMPCSMQEEAVKEGGGWGVGAGVQSLKEIRGRRAGSGMRPLRCHQFFDKS